MSGGNNIISLLGWGLVGAAMFPRWVCSCLRSRWHPVGTLQSIQLYPLKSGAPVSVHSAVCGELGLRHLYFSDRMFVVYDAATNTVVTAKTDPNLLKIQVLPTSTHLVVRFSTKSGREPLKLDLSKIKQDSMTIKMKFPTTSPETLETIDCGDAAASWISSELDRTEARLGYWPPGFRRDICKPRARELPIFKQINNTIAGAYSNMSSYLLLNSASVDDLVSKLGPGSSVGPENFRANLVITGAEAFAEDNWKSIKIGNATFNIVKPCVRCILVTTDPKTLKRDPNLEPLKTLKSYRQLECADERSIEGDSPVMGCYMGLATRGTVAAGDTVYASTSEHK